MCIVRCCIGKIVGVRIGLLLCFNVHSQRPLGVDLLSPMIHLSFERLFHLMTPPHRIPHVFIAMKGPDPTLSLLQHALATSLSAWMCFPNQTSFSHSVHFYTLHTHLSQDNLNMENSQIDMSISPSPMDPNDLMTGTTLPTIQHANSILQPSQPSPSKATPLQGGKRHLPCNARSVPPDHTEETAYFEIPPDAKHGMPLTCCHPACHRRQAKRPRFQYCAICYRAVSSQNFYRRHSLPASIQTNAENTASQSAYAGHMVDDSNNTPSMHAQSLPLASVIHVNPLFDPQATLTTVQLTQQEMRWLQLLHSRPAFTATTSRKEQWIESILATMHMDMKKGMAMVLNLSEMVGVPGAATFQIPVVSPSPADLVKACTLSFWQNDEADGPDDEALSFQSLKQPHEQFQHE